jgi:hypothetical protein
MSCSAMLSQNLNAEVSVRKARLGACFGWISTAAWVAIGVDSILRPIQDNRDVFWWLPFGLFVLTIVAVHRTQRSRGLRMEHYTYYVLIVASALALLGNVGVMLNISLLATMGFPGGAIVFALGLIVFGIATWRARVFPRYVAMALMLWEPGSIATGLLLAPISPLHDRGAYSAGVWKGLATGIIAAGLQVLARTYPNRQERAQAAPPSSSQSKQG